MGRKELISEVERDFRIFTDFCQVCGMNQDLINCALRIQNKVRGLYAEPDPVAARAPAPEPAPEPEEPPPPPPPPKVRAPRKVRARRPRTYRPKSRPTVEREPQTFEPIHVEANARWG